MIERRPMNDRFFVSIPHSGEKVPKEATWLKNLPEPVLMCDVDRYVDLLYLPHLKKNNIEGLVTPWHRYVVDPNRSVEDVDKGSVEGAVYEKGKHLKGLLWQVTTKGDVLMPRPISQELLEKIILNYYQPFQNEIEKAFTSRFKKGIKNVYHLDAHSMPSIGTSLHEDPGEERAEVVVSDQNGKSCSLEFFELVCESYKSAGFEVKTNWPYFGGGITKRFGQPDKGQHTVQVELNRRLYMNESTKRKNEGFKQIQNKIGLAISNLVSQIDSLVK